MSTNAHTPERIPHGVGDPGVAIGGTTLVKGLGVAFALAVTVGGMVGQGILRTPGIVAGAVPHPTLILVMWTVVGLLCILDACAHVEMAAATPRAGGPYAFADRSFGPVGGTITGWADALNNIGAIGFLAVVSAEFVQRIGPMAGAPISVLAPAIVLAFLGVNLIGTRVGGASQTLGSLLKVLALIAIIGLLVSSSPAERGPADGLPPALTFGALVIALRAIRTTYDGWNSATYFCEEMPNPGRDLPRTVFGGIVLVTATYVAINAALLHAMSPAEMAASNLPVAEAMRSLLGDGAEQVTSIFAAISALAVTNLFVMFCSRTAFGMARDGVLPRALSVVSGDGAPRRALLAVALPGAALAASGSYQTLLALTVPAALVVNILVNLAALRLRRTEPDLPRPFRTPLFPLPIIFSTLISLALLIALAVETPGITLGFLAVIGVAALARILTLRR